MSSIALEVSGMFIATALLDWLWARYTLYVTQHKRVQASILASLLYVIGGTVVVSYNSNHWLLIPAAIGAFAGTFVATTKESGLSA